MNDIIYEFVLFALQIMDERRCTYPTENISVLKSIVREHKGE